MNYNKCDIGHRNIETFWSDGLIFVTTRHISVEHFEEGVLILDVRNRRLFECSYDEGWVLSQFDGNCSFVQVVKKFSKKFGIGYEEARKKVEYITTKLLKLQFLILMEGALKGEIMKKVYYIQNPDVNLREADEDGALLYNPDTDQVQLLNTTGLYIWNLCKEGKTVDEIVKAFMEDFESVPENDVVADVEEFLNQMVETGFIGTMEAK